MVLKALSTFLNVNFVAIIFYVEELVPNTGIQLSCEGELPVRIECIKRARWCGSDKENICFGLFCFSVAWRYGTGRVIYPDPHQSVKLEPDQDPHQFADDRPICMEYKPIWALFQGFEPLFGN